MVRDSFINDMKRFSGFILFLPAIICCMALTTDGGYNHFEGYKDLIRTGLLNDERPLKINFFDLELVPPSSGVQFYRNGIVFLGHSKNYRKMVPSHVSFGTVQVYYAVSLDTSLQNPEIFSPDFRFSSPCDAISFNASYDKMYFTKKDKTSKYDKIYESDYSGGRDGKGSWSDAAQPLDFCSGNFVYTHPALSYDGEFMIFASDREGSTGGLDLFITRKEGEKWTEPENLGRLINTKSNENYPFLDKFNNLYFSSDGHPGYGGYDVFVSKFNGKKWEEPVNLTKLINSQDDDVAFKIDRINCKTGFYSSIDNLNKRYSQLYKIILEDKAATASQENLTDILFGRALADTTFTYEKLLIAKADDIARAAKEAKESEVERIAGEAEEAKISEAGKAAEVKRLADEAKAAGAKRLADEAKAVEAKRLADEAKAAAIAKSKPADKQIKAKVDTVKLITPIPEKLKDVVVYRVQFLSSVTPKNIKEVVVEGKSYTLYVYFYLKEYRYTAGEFTTLEPARQLQFAMRKAGYPQAFVAAFKNNVRSLDLSLFR